MLAVSNLSKTFPLDTGLFGGRRGTFHALKDVSFEVKTGESWGIVGESGSGKTTLCKIMAGFLPADRGTVSFSGENLLAMPRTKRSRIAQMVFQDPFASLNPKLLLRTQLEEAVALERLNPGPGRKRKSGSWIEIRHRTDSPWRTFQDDELGALMSDVGLPAAFLSRYPHQLSGGQRQRFALARALAAGPQLLLADEPVSSLDVSVQAQIINLLNDVRRKKKFTQLVISHDLAVIAHTCDHVLVMKDGGVVEHGVVAQVLAAPAHAYTQKLLSSVPRL